MTDVAVSSREGRSGPVAPAVFALAVFTSAALVFIVQPMIAKMILPKLGGSPAVWNTSMVFFQAALLAGYAYAHALQRVKSLRRQVMIHVGALVVAGLFLPLRVTGVFGDPSPDAPIAWLLGVLFVSVGAPFAVLSATAPLMQAWYARLRSGEADAKNPYVLYAASNLGSFAALLAYPAIIEPLLRLSWQTLLWTGGYVVFLAVVGYLAWTARRVGAEGAADEPLPSSAPITNRQRLTWVLLAAAPSSLMLGVTTHLTTDVASAPFLWVAPLALYLLTFVIAFQDRPWIPRHFALIIHAALAGLVACLMPFNTGEWLFLFLVHLGGFFFTALVCHQALADRKPPVDRLTEFYLWLSVGGVVGGALTALLAPVIFNVVREYPIVLALALLARPWGKGTPTTLQVGAVVVSIILSFAGWLMITTMKANPDLARSLSWNDAEALGRVMLFLAWAASMAVHQRAWLLFACIGAMLISSHALAGRYNWIESDRSFFGVLRTARYDDVQLGGEVRMLLHGTTLHGAQAVAPEHRCAPMLYYAPVTPIGQAAQAVQASHPNGAAIGVVGLGTGAMATYKRANDRLTYYEIDPLVVKFATDPARFSYVSNCAEGEVDFVMGDARLSLEKGAADKYDLLLVDAFSSDSVPTHLLTVEAIQSYLRAIKPDGVVVLHLSNRNLEITTPAKASAAAAGAATLHQIYSEDPNAAVMSEASTEALLLARNEAALERFKADPRWRPSDPGDTRPWTDDFTNLLGALARDVATSVQWWWEDNVEARFGKKAE